MHIKILNSFKWTFGASTFLNKNATEDPGIMWLYLVSEWLFKWSKLNICLFSYCNEDENRTKYLLDKNWPHELMSEDNQFKNID